MEDHDLILPCYYANDGQTISYEQLREPAIELSLDNGFNVPETLIVSNSREKDIHPGELSMEDDPNAYRELEELRKAVVDLKRENVIKDRQCQEAVKSLRDLQNELMRKSMHVGSLAFAIEGQVKEKSLWFSSLRDLKRKVKILKMEQISISEEALQYNKCLEQDMINMGSIIQAKVIEQVQSQEKLKLKFMKTDKERKELYNKLLEFKGNIRVFCRCRPLNNEEIASRASTTIDFQASKDGELTVKSNGLPNKTFKFDRVFGPEANQCHVFADTAPFATSVLDGYNVCIFAYGQTGTGKTFTMEGTDKARGVNFRTLDQLFHIIEERKDQFRYEISVSVLEVYNEQIRDLLGVTSKSRLEIRQVGDGIHNVPGLVEARVKNINEVWDVLQTGSNARAVGSTNANEQSSRSHCIHCVMVKGENLLNGESSTKSKLWLVDLAGSERIAKTNVQGERLKETQNINRSLSALGDVISALATKSSHIPFRNSKLSHLLQDSLGGDSKTLMFVQISPNENDLSETLCSLNFANRVRGVELGPAKKQFNITELFKFKHMAEKCKVDIKTKDVQIKKLEDTIHGFDAKLKEKDLKNKKLQEKVKELESQFLIERRLARQHVESKIAGQQQKQHQEESRHLITRPTLASRPLKDYKYSNESKQLLANEIHPLTESNRLQHYGYMEKQNLPKMSEQLQVQKRVPSSSAKFTLNQTTKGNENDEETEKNEVKQCGDSEEEAKKVRRRRSFKKKKKRSSSPMALHQQTMMRKGGGINVRMEKVRVSIGNQGKLLARRVLLINNNNAARRDILPLKQNQRGWNI